MGQAQNARMAAYRAALEGTWNRQSQPVRECEATYTLDRQIAAARAEMGEAEWRRLNAEWPQQEIS